METSSEEYVVRNTDLSNMKTDYGNFGNDIENSK